VHALSIHDYLFERFPPLALAGGYEFCLFQRGGEDQGFYKLPTPYSPARLKDVAGQAIIYIRPLQRNIPSGIQNQEQHVQSEVSGEMPYPKTFCNKNAYYLKQKFIEKRTNCNVNLHVTHKVAA